VVFTDKNTFVLPFPKVSGSYAITKFGPAEIVDDSGKSIPLDEVYNHHWLIFNTKGNSGVCGDFLSYIFGVGAESRRTPTEFPDGYGYVVSPRERWTANIHLLRTQELLVLPGGNKSGALKECIECWWAPGKGCSPLQNGQFACCQSGSKCPTLPNVLGKKSYHLSYSITYTQQVQSIKPVHMYLLDASNCQVETNIYPNPISPDWVTQFSWKSQVSGDIVFAAGHVHNAAINISLFVNMERKCLTTAIYGTQPNVPGNEKGYLVKNTPCTEKFYVAAGQEITVRSHYWTGMNDHTGSGLPGGMHGGVMSYMYIAYSTETMRDEKGNHVTDPTLVQWEPWSGKAPLFGPSGAVMV